MQWRGGRRSTNVEDRRGMRVGTGVAGVGLGSIVLLLIGMFLGVDPSVILNNPTVDPGSSEPAAAPPVDDEMAEFWLQLRMATRADYDAFQADYVENFARRDALVEHVGAPAGESDMPACLEQRNCAGFADAGARAGDDCRFGVGCCHVCSPRSSPAFWIRRRMGLAR